MFHYYWTPFKGALCDTKKNDVIYKQPLSRSERDIILNMVRSSPGNTNVQEKSENEFKTFGIY